MIDLTYSDAEILIECADAALARGAANGNVYKGRRINAAKEKLTDFMRDERNKEALPRP